MSRAIPPAQQGHGCVLLPVRRLPFVVGWALVVLVPLLLLGAGPTSDPVTRAQASWPLLVVTTPAISAWAAWRLLRCDLRLRLDPSGITVPWFWRSTVDHVPWDRIAGVEVGFRARPVLVLVHRAEHDRPSVTTVLDLRVQAWHASMLRTLLTRCADDPSARALLTDAAAVDRSLGRAGCAGRSGG